MDGWKCSANLLGARDRAHFIIQGAYGSSLRRRGSDAGLWRWDTRGCSLQACSSILVAIAVTSARFVARQQPEFDAPPQPLVCVIFDSVVRLSFTSKLLLLPARPSVHPCKVQQQPFNQQHDKADGPSKHEQDVTECHSFAMQQKSHVHEPLRIGYGRRLRVHCDQLTRHDEVGSSACGAA